MVLVLQEDRFKTSTDLIWLKPLVTQQFGYEFKLGVVKEVGLMLDLQLRIRAGTCRQLRVRVVLRWG